MQKHEPARLSVSAKRIAIRKARKRLLLLAVLLASSELTGASGSDETDLLARNAIPADGRGVTDVLVVTSTVGVLDGLRTHKKHRDQQRYTTMEKAA